jgi:predicted RNA-binding Zn-ribbon protein involved in translation (DUF1610 family)
MPYGSGAVGENHHGWVAPSCLSPLSFLPPSADTGDMTAIRIKCPTCGEVDLSPEEMSLFMAPSGDQLSYSFTCPVCSLEVDRPTTRKTAAMLIAAGVETVPLQYDDEPALPLEDRSPDPDAPPLTLDDLIELHFLLQADDALAALAGR